MSSGIADLAASNSALSFPIPPWSLKNLITRLTLISKICLRCVSMLLHTQPVNMLGTELFDVGCPVGEVVHPLFQPGIALGFRFCMFVVLTKELVIAIVVSLHWRWVRTIGTLDDRINQKPGNRGAIWVAGNDLWSNNFFCYHDHALGCAHAFEHYPEISPAMRVAIHISPLHMHDGHVRVKRAYRPQRFLRRKRREYLIEKVIALGRVTAQRGFGRQKGHSHCACLQRERDDEIGHIEDFHSILLDRAAEVVG